MRSQPGKAVNPYLCLVLAAAALKGLVAQVGNCNKPTHVANVHAVWVRRLKQALSQKLCCTVRNLTVALHLSETQATISVTHMDSDYVLTKRGHSKQENTKISST